MSRTITLDEFMVWNVTLDDVSNDQLYTLGLLKSMGKIYFEKALLSHEPKPQSSSVCSAI